MAQTAGSKPPFSGVGCSRMEQTPFDKVERDILQIVRLFFLSFHEPGTHAWVGALTCAETWFGETHGAAIANAVLKAVHSVRHARTAGFSYSDPTCRSCHSYITHEERYFTSVLHGLRQKKTTDVKTNAMLLCQGADYLEFLQKMTCLVQVIERSQNEKAF